MDELQGLGAAGLGYDDAAHTDSIERKVGVQNLVAVLSFGKKAPKSA